MKRICISVLFLCFILSCSDGIKHVKGEVQRGIEVGEVKIILGDKVKGGGGNEYSFGENFANVVDVEFTVSSSENAVWVLPKDDYNATEMCFSHLEKEMSADGNITVEMPVATYQDMSLVIIVKKEESYWELSYHPDGDVDFTKDGYEFKCTDLSFGENSYYL